MGSRVGAGRTTGSGVRTGSKGGHGRTGRNQDVRWGRDVPVQTRLAVGMGLWVDTVRTCRLWSLGSGRMGGPRRRWDTRFPFPCTSSPGSRPSRRISSLVDSTQNCRRILKRRPLLTARGTREEGSRRPRSHPLCTRDRFRGRSGVLISRRCRPVKTGDLW